MDCLFCKIIAGTIPSTPVYQDDLCYAFFDIDPKAPVHVLVVPRTHIASLADARKEDEPILGHLMLAAAEVARIKGLSNGYRVAVSIGKDGGQTVDHLHVHVLGGRAMGWPPG
jgi:histidine triad (HIT) family protein